MESGIVPHRGFLRDYSSEVERFFDTEKVAGSIPAGLTLRKQTICLRSKQPYRLMA